MKTKSPKTEAGNAEDKYAELALAWKRFSVRITKIHNSLEGYKKS
jgi:hypothetical protein